MFALVVGARGFIGSVLVDDLLARNISVDCVTRGSLPTEHRPGVRWVRLDHQSQQSWDEIVANKYDVIYHLGWSTIPRTAELDPIADLIENVGGGLRLLLAVRRCAPKSRIIFTSSGGTVYGRTASVVVDETHPTKPISAYGLAKLTFERYLATFRTEHGLDCVSARVSNPYGPDQNTNRSFGVISTFVQQALHGQELQIFGSTSITRDFIYISDVSSALVALLELKSLPECINIGSGEGVRLIEVIGIIENLLNRKIAYKLQAPRPFDVQEIVLDISAIRSISDWKPSIRPKDGIARLISYYTSPGRSSAS